MNPYQEYISDLLNEYGSLLKRQLIKMIYYKFKVIKTDIDGYAAQMCRYGGYSVVSVGTEEALCKRGTEPDFDIIRSFDVLLAFMPKVQHHRKSKNLISIAFFITTETSEKEVFVIPVKQGAERMVMSFAADKFDGEKNNVVIFLLEDKNQLKIVRAGENHRFAIIDQNGVSFLKLSNQNN